MSLRDRALRAIDALIGPASVRASVDVHPADLRSARGGRPYYGGTGTLLNQVDRIGTEDDVSFWDCFALKRPLTDYERLAAARDALVRRGLSLVVDEAIAGGWSPAFSDDRIDDPTALSRTVLDYERRLKAPTVLGEAGFRGRQFGHAVVLMGIDDGLPPDQPVDRSRIKTIHWLHVIDRRDYQIGPLLGNVGEGADRLGEFDHITISDINGILPEGLRHPGLYGIDGGPENFMISTRQTKVHRDRLLFLPAPDWLPVIDSARDYMASWWRTNRGIVRGVEESAISIFKVEHWIDKMFGADASEAIERMRLASRMKSAMASLVLDKDREDFEYVQRALGGLGQAADPIMVAVAAAWGYPVTKYWGVSPSGFSTGDSDITNFEKVADQWRRETLEPPLGKLQGYIILAQDGGALGFDPTRIVDFGDLTPPDETRESENNKRTADALLAAVEKQVLLPSEVAPKLAELYGIDLDTEQRQMLAASGGERPDLPVGTAQAVLALLQAVGEGTVQESSGRALLPQLSSRFTPEVSTEILPPPPEPDPSEVEVEEELEEVAEVDRPPEGEDAVTPREAAQALNVPTRTITLAIQRGDLREFNVLGKRKLSLEAVRAFVREANAQGEGEGEGEGEPQIDESEEEREARAKKEFRRLVNMTPSQIREWAETPWSKMASIERRTVIDRVLRLLEKKQADWTAKDIGDALKVVAFISRMSKAEQGKPMKHEGREGPSKRDASLRNWGHNP